ncbi:MAG: DUF853 family protein, partial [Rhodobacteraceae bacterium]|nr:DUF853 family protein [Paracoccaceae bacterium]
KKGVPSVVERVLIRPPSSQLGPITAAERAGFMATSPVAGLYEEQVDRESAYEVLKKRAEQAAAAAASAEVEAETADPATREFNTARRYSGARVSRSTARRRGDSVGEAFAKSMARSIGTRTGSALVRGILGGLFKAR